MLVVVYGKCLAIGGAEASYVNRQAGGNAGDLTKAGAVPEGRRKLRRTAITGTLYDYSGIKDVTIVLSLAHSSSHGISTDGAG